MSALRFCMVTTFYPPYNFGGDGIGIQRLARALVARGHEVTVVCDTDAYRLLGPGTLPSPPPADDGVVLVPLRSRIAPLSVLLTHQTGHPVIQGRALRQALAPGKFDVINFHNLSLVGGPGALAFGDAIKLYTAWEHWLVCPTHVLWRHGRELCTGRQCVRCSLHYRRPPQLWRWFGGLERQLDHVDAFIALSEFSRDKHRELGFPRDMKVIPGFLPEAPDAAGNAEASPHPRPYFFFAGRLERIKGLDDVIPLFQDYPDADFLIAGDGEYRATLEAIAAGNPRVHFLGRLRPEQLDRYYRHAVASIVPSVVYETFGLVVIEAFRLGTPVLARAVGPLPELVARSGGGETFTTAAELRASMHRLQHDPRYREGLAAAAVSGFAAQWSEGVVIPRYLDLVAEIARRKKNARVLEILNARGAGGSRA